MIVRPPQSWFVRLFNWHGSVLSMIIFRLGLNLFMAIVAIIAWPYYENLNIHLTVAPFSLLGIAIAIFLGFRNNASYSRYTEARMIWGTVSITSRSLMRQVMSALPADREVQMTVSRHLTAFNWQLNHQLRETDATSDLQRLLPAERAAEVKGSTSPANRILLLLATSLANLRREDKISDFVWQNMDENLNELSRCLGGCERIANTPVPFAYSLILQRTVYLFCTLLPLALVSDLHLMTPFVSVFISYAFLSWDSIAEEMEHPFGTHPNNLALNAICTSIERNLMDMTGQSPLPPLPVPDERFNLI
ncbi:ibestrophin [Yokenella regensburgei]|uniref:bestrophin family protein n=1 Tax=Yokenella regensburgei TaxID=158877 RepID=UPI003F165B1C